MKLRPQKQHVHDHKAIQYMIADPLPQKMCDHEVTSKNTIPPRQKDELSQIWVFLAPFTGNPLQTITSISYYAQLTQHITGHALVR